MRILIFSQYYIPEQPIFRPFELAPSLVKRGHEVVVITGSPCYPKGKIYKGYKAFDLRLEIIEGVRVLRVPVFPDHSRSALRRIVYYSSIALGATFAGPIVAKDFDAAFVFHPPLTLGFPAILTKYLRDVPFVYDVQDLWPESLVATEMINNRTILNILARIERFNYRQAAAITVISPGFKQNLIGKGVPSDKIHISPNWVDASTYRPMERNNHFTQALGLAGKFNIIYAGNMGLPQKLENVLQAAKLLRDMTDIEFVFVGDGVEKASLENTVRANSLKNVRFLNRISPQEMSAIYALSDVLLVHLRKDPLFAITIPNKTISYLAAGRPILVCVEGDAAQVVLNAGAGIACPPEDPPSLAACVKQFFFMSSETRIQMGENGRIAFQKFYERETVVSQYEQIFYSISGHKNVRK